MDYISIPFPKDLYRLIVVRSGGKLDPALLAVDQVETFIDFHRDDVNFWTDEGLGAFAEESASAAPDVGDLGRGHQWGPVFLPNGTELRMKYKGKYQYARVEYEGIVHDGQRRPSISQWVRSVAARTSRNAWHDVWVRFPQEKEYRYADAIRDERMRK